MVSKRDRLLCQLGMGVFNYLFPFTREDFSALVVSVSGGCSDGGGGLLCGKTAREPSFFARIISPSKMLLMSSFIFVFIVVTNASLDGGSPWGSQDDGASC